MNHKYTEEVLTRLRVAVGENFGSQALHYWKVDGMWDEVANYLVVRLSAFVWAGQQSKITVKVPDGWFQQWKLERAPSWLIKRYPVKYKDMDIDVMPYFPNLRRISKDTGSELRYRILNPTYF